MNLSQLTEYDTFLFHQGTNCKAYEMLGAHITEEDGQQGVRFSVWAPNAKSVSVVGEFNNWDTRVNEMSRIEDGEIWKIFIPGIKEGDIYKYAIKYSYDESCSCFFGVSLRASENETKI